MAAISSRKISYSPATILTFPIGTSLNHSSGALLGKIHGLGMSIPGSEVLIITGHILLIMSGVKRSLNGAIVIEGVVVNMGLPGDMRRADPKRELGGRLYDGTMGCGCW
jgi:hypothetical protein